MRPRLSRYALGERLDPQDAFLRRYADEPNAFWLDSGRSGRHFLGVGEPVALRTGEVLAGLRAALADTPLAATEAGFGLGLVGWFDFELLGETMGLPVAPRGVPAAFLRVTEALEIDAATGEAWLLTIGGAELDLPPRRERPPFRPGHLVAAEDEASYVAKIRACQDAIHAGEAYQLCLTSTITAAGVGDPVAVYLRLRTSSPSHHGGYLRIGGTTLLSSSPERFLEVDGGRVATHPIKGTRPRGATPEEDARLAAELLASEKEQAENLMIVDLMRNDLQRVCAVGSVEVTRLLAVESYPNVHQLVSTVEGELLSGLDALHAVGACFPAGSMTGAPKRRAVQLLAGLEGRPRGVYSGAFGWLGFDGRAELAMVIRSIVVRDGVATVGAGGGITALSVPEEEYAEMRLKAEPLLAALLGG